MTEEKFGFGTNRASMNTLIARGIAKITPARLLPTGTKSTSQGHSPLDVLERRELLERKLAHRLNVFLDKYSPIRIFIKFRREKLLEAAQTRFYCLIGKIALTHAGIEQDLKNTLVVDWEVTEINKLIGKEVKLDKLYGKSLREKFPKLLKELLIPPKYLEEYKTLCQAFWTASERRNATLKAIYAFDQETAEVSRVHEKNHAKWDRSLTYEELIEAWLPKIEMSDLQELREDLLDIRNRFNSVRGEIFVDKMRLHSELCSEIGKSYPLHAFKNPYLYRASLEHGKACKGEI